jgi:hypothetical protein
MAGSDRAAGCSAPGLLAQRRRGRCTTLTIAPAPEPIGGSVTYVSNSGPPRKLARPWPFHAPHGHCGLSPFTELLSTIGSGAGAFVNAAAPRRRYGARRPGARAPRRATSCRASWRVRGVGRNELCPLPLRPRGGAADAGRAPAHRRSRARGSNPVSSRAGAAHHPKISLRNPEGEKVMVGGAASGPLAFSFPASARPVAISVSPSGGSRSRTSRGKARRPRLRRTCRCRRAFARYRSP